MKWQVNGKTNFPVLKFDLEQGESIKSQPGSMLAMSKNIVLRGKMDGGILKGIARKFSGESFFMQQAKAEEGKGWITISTPTPGDILEVEVKEDKEIYAQKDAFIASTNDVEISTKVQGIFKGLISGEGLFVVKLTGAGTAFLETYGSIYELEVKEGAEVIIDNSNIVAWESSLDYEITKGASGWVSAYTSGSGFVCRFSGNGKVWAQTCNLRNLAGAIQPYLKNKFFNNANKRK